MSENSQSWGGGWFSSWIDAAREKSATTLELIKNDLTEFSNVMTDDAAQIVGQTTSLVKDYIPSTSAEEQTEEEKTSASYTAEFVEPLKSGFGSLMSGLSKAVYVGPDDSADITLRIDDDGKAIYDRLQARLDELQRDETTFTTSLLEDDAISMTSSFTTSSSMLPVETFSVWLESFSLEDRKKDISGLLMSNSRMRTIYTKLVPAKVSNEEFWSRYLYRVYLLEYDEKRRQELVKRADELAKEGNTKTTDNDWEDFDSTSPENSSESKPDDSVNEKLMQNQFNNHPSTKTSPSQDENTSTDKYSDDSCTFRDVPILSEYSETMSNISNEPPLPQTSVPGPSTSNNTDKSDNTITESQNKLQEEIQMSDNDNTASKISHTEKKETSNIISESMSPAQTEVKSVSVDIVVNDVEADDSHKSVSSNHNSDDSVVSENGSYSSSTNNTTSSWDQLTNNSTSTSSSVVMINTSVAVDSVNNTKVCSDESSETINLSIDKIEESMEKVEIDDVQTITQSTVMGSGDESKIDDSPKTDADKIDGSNDITEDWLVDNDDGADVLELTEEEKKILETMPDVEKINITQTEPSLDFDDYNEGKSELAVKKEIDENNENENLNDWESWDE